MSQLLQSIEHYASINPDRTVVTGSHLSLNWDQLSTAITEVIGELKGSLRIGLFLRNSPAWIVADLAAIAADVTNVPLPIFFTDVQLAHAIDDACLDTIITDNPQRIESLVTAADRVELPIAGTDCTILRIPAPTAAIDPATTGKITYTSGTTGTPRGVRLSETTMETVAHSLAQAANANTSDRALVLLPLSILLENIGSIYVPILTGAQIAVPDADELGISGSSQVNVQKLADALNRIRPTTLIVPPNLLKLLVGLAEQEMLPDSFRYIAVGGAPVGTALLENARALGLPIFQGYGLSETGSVVTVNTLEENRLGSVGKPLAHSAIRVNSDGEIHASGMTFEGYLNDTDFDADELATGDLGYLDDDGFLYVTGRRQHRIITGFGRNISPEWVESELNSHRSIAQAVVFGNGLPFLVAIIVINPKTTTEALSRAVTNVNQRLPDYARIGDYIITDRAFSLSTGELTASGAPARDVIEQHYITRIENLTRETHEQLL